MAIPCTRYITDAEAKELYEGVYLNNLTDTQLSQLFDNLKEQGPDVDLFKQTAVAIALLATALKQRIEPTEPVTHD